MTRYLFNSKLEVITPPPQVMYYVLCLRLLFIVLISVIYWCILFHYNQNLAPDSKKIPAPRETIPFLTRPVFWTPDRTDPRFKQNMAP